MIVLRLLPVILSTLLFTAHLMRFNGFPLAIVVITLLLTLFIRKSRIIRLWQILLALAALKWVIIAIELIHMRIAFDLPYLRLAIILIAVVIFNVFSIFWLQNRKIQSFYRNGGEEL